MSALRLLAAGVLVAAVNVQAAPAGCPFLNDQVELSDEQQVQIQQLMQAHRAQMQQLHRQMRQQIEEVLTEEQRSALSDQDWMMGPGYGRKMGAGQGVGQPGPGMMRGGRGCQWMTSDPDNGGSSTP